MIVAVISVSSAFWIVNTGKSMILKYNQRAIILFQNGSKRLQNVLLKRFYCKDSTFQWCSLVSKENKSFIKRNIYK